MIIAADAGILARATSRSSGPATSEEIYEHVSFLRRIARLVEPEVGVPVVLNDPKDDPIVYAAIAAGSDVLCVRDRDFYLPNVIAFCRRHGVETMDEITLLSKLE